MEYLDVGGSHSSMVGTRAVAEQMKTRKSKKKEMMDTESQIIATYSLLDASWSELDDHSILPACLQYSQQCHFQQD